MPMLANLKRLAPEPEPELVTIWDGSHGNQDWDLLHVDLRTPEKFTPTPGARVSVLDLVERAMRRAGTPVTLRQLMAATDLSLQSATSGLYTLRQQGRLGSRDLAGMTRGVHGGRAYREYWLKGFGG